MDQLKKQKQKTFIELSKPQLWLWMHGIFIGAVMLYQSLWLFSVKTMASCNANVYGTELQRMNSGTLLYTYFVNGKQYDDYTTRNETPLTQHTIEIRYLSFAPSFSRINSFEGNWLGFIIAYLISLP